MFVIRSSRTLKDGILLEKRILPKVFKDRLLTGKKGFAKFFVRIFTQLGFMYLWILLTIILRISQYLIFWYGFVYISIMIVKLKVELEKGFEVYGL